MLRTTGSSLTPPLACIGISGHDLDSNSGVDPLAVSAQAERALGRARRGRLASGRTGGGNCAQGPSHPDMVEQLVNPRAPRRRS